MSDAQQKTPHNADPPARPRLEYARLRCPFELEHVDVSRNFPRPASLIIVGTLLACAALAVDLPVAQSMLDERVRTWMRRIFGLPAAAAVFLTPLAVLASFPNRRRLWLGFALPLVVSTIITHALKWSVGRARPYMDLGAFEFRSFAWISDFEEYWLNGKFESFPSGHSSAAGTLALLLGIYFPRMRWVFYFFAGLVGLERVYNHRHFVSDVLAGFVVACISVALCVRLLGWRYYQKDKVGA